MRGRIWVESRTLPKSRHLKLPKKNPPRMESRIDNCSTRLFPPPIFLPMSRNAFREVEFDTNYWYVTGFQALQTLPSAFPAIVSSISFCAGDDHEKSNMTADRMCYNKGRCFLEITGIRL